MTTALMHWSNYRYKELEEKAENCGLSDDDAYYHSISRRLDNVAQAAMWFEDDDGIDTRFTEEI